MAESVDRSEGISYERAAAAPASRDIDDLDGGHFVDFVQEDSTA